MSKKAYIGIDCGKHTGIALSVGGELKSLMTVPIHNAMFFVLECLNTYGKDLFVIFEDARQRKWIPTGNRSQGAGSVKRDAVIWEDFLKDLGIRYRAVPPRKGSTKWDAETFARITGWTGRTSNHARDAALLVYGK